MVESKDPRIVRWVRFGKFVRYLHSAHCVALNSYGNFHAEKDNRQDLYARLNKVPYTYRKRKTFAASLCSMDIGDWMLFRFLSTLPLKMNSPRGLEKRIRPSIVVNRA
jgi:hypothetical protein